MVEDIDLHVIGKTESWANIHLQDAELVHTGYVMLRRIGRGGVILYVKESIQADEIKLEREADYNEAYLMTLSGLFAHWEHGPSTMVLHPCLFAQWEHRPSTMVLHPCLFVVKKIRFFPGVSHLLSFISVYLCQIFLRFPLFSFLSFLSVCLIHLHFLLFISFFTCMCSVLSHNIMLDILSDHFLMKVCILFSVFCFV